MYANKLTAKIVFIKWKRPSLVIWTIMPFEFYTSPLALDLNFGRKRPWFLKALFIRCFVRFLFETLHEVSEIKANISEKLRKLILSITSVPFIYINFRKAGRIFFSSDEFCKIFCTAGSIIWCECFVMKNATFTR